MGWYPDVDIAASGLYAQRVTLNVIADNIANVKTTRTPDGGPYRRKEVILRAQDKFESVLETTRQIVPLYVTHPAHIEPTVMKLKSVGEGGVEVDEIAEDVLAPFKFVYDPSHPDADSSGYVKFPNIDVVRELTDMLVARRAYEANVAVINASKSMARSALEIGR